MKLGSRDINSYGHRLEVKCLQCDDACPATVACIGNSRGLLQVLCNQGVSQRVKECRLQLCVPHSHQIKQPRHTCSVCFGFSEIFQGKLSFTGLKVW